MKTDNEVLAEFMDEVVFHKRPRHYIGATENMKPYKLASKLKYDISYDWLMPVWYKFKKLDFSQIDTTFKDRVANAILHSGCAEASKLLAEGIRWYQSIKK